MSKIMVDFNKEQSRIKPIHGLGQPPFTGMNYSMFSYLKEANIPFSRLHDVGGPYGGFRYVDIPNIFRDFSADPKNPEAYDFVFTDTIITALVENGVEPFFRLGVTIENYAKTKAYRIYPPEDYKKWAEICEGIIRHYTEGWANGFRYKITYWEIWNEPDNQEDMYINPMWRGTKEQFYELYDVAAKHLKEKFPHLKIGGYGSSGFYAIEDSYVQEANSSHNYGYFITFFDGFLNYIKEHNSPLDFFSWHSYDEIYKNVIYAYYARKRLDEAGYKNTETTCNEWHCMPDKGRTMLHAANNTAMLIALQNSPLDSAMFYDARIGLSIYGGLFHPIEKKPYPLYYGFQKFGKLYKLGTQVFASCDNKELYVLPAAKGGKGGILIVNVGEETPLELEIFGAVAKRCEVLDSDLFKESPIPKSIEENTIIYIETESKFPK